MKITNALKGIGGEFEVQRILGAVGTLTYIVMVPTFVSTGVIKGVSLAEFCGAYPIGLAACLGAAAGAVVLKDRGVATSKIVEQTGAIPVKPPAGPSVNAEDVKP